MTSPLGPPVVDRRMNVRCVVATINSPLGCAARSQIDHKAMPLTAWAFEHQPLRPIGIADDRQLVARDRRRQVCLARVVVDAIHPRPG